MAQTFADNKMLQQWWNRAISTASFFFIIFMPSDTLVFFQKNTEPKPEPNKSIKIYIYE